MRVAILLFALAAVALAHSSGSSTTSSSTVTSATAFLIDGVWSVRPGANSSGVAWATYDEAVLVKGWSELTVQTNGAFSDDDQFYAAGMVEGFLTAEACIDNYINMLFYYWGNVTEPPAEFTEWFIEQDNWARNMVATNTSSPIWQVTGLVLQQFDGLVAGFNNSEYAGTLNATAFSILNGVGDLIDLVPALNETARQDLTKLSPEELREVMAKRGHCSGLIKITPDYSDLFMAHSSWFTYGAMSRIMKHYYFDVANKNVMSHKMAFSSYPGFLESLDDYYQMASKEGAPQNNIVMIQTTNSIINLTLYELVKPQSLLAWQRVRTANHMSVDGEQWCSIISEYNSGTYNNQYMVVDLNAWEAGEMINDGFLYVCEQIPGLVVSGDQSEALQLGYWASYNIPAYTEIWEKSGYPSLASQQYGQNYTWDLAPRAQIFRRNQTDVVDLDTFKDLMRYNNYETDPLSHDSPWDAICSRGDLADPSSPFGCIDTKVADVNMALNLTMHAISGPTSVQQKPFSWTPAFSEQASHLGMAETFTFPFYEFHASFD